MSDPFDLQRFLDAQDAGATYETALAELRAGRKRSHWMWFVFPQIAGLGRSAMAQRYAIASLAEARAYLAHPVLGPRLLDCARRARSASTARRRSPCSAASTPMKLRSSMTLFAARRARRAALRRRARPVLRRRARPGDDVPAVGRRPSGTGPTVPP